VYYPKREVRPNGGQSRYLDPILFTIYRVLIFRRENPCLQPFGVGTAVANAAMVDSTNDTSRAISNITVLSRVYSKCLLKDTSGLLREAAHTKPHSRVPFEWAAPSHTGSSFREHPFMPPCSGHCHEHDVSSIPC
jgi:hypothetical protein